MIIFGLWRRLNALLIVSVCLCVLVMSVYVCVLVVCVFVCVLVICVCHEHSTGPHGMITFGLWRRLSALLTSNASCSRLPCGLVCCWCCCSCWSCCSCYSCCSCSLLFSYSLTLHPISSGSPYVSQHSSSSPFSFHFFFFFSFSYVSFLSFFFFSLFFSFFLFSSPSHCPGCPLCLHTILLQRMCKSSH
jgi:hypothetical protein